MLYGVKITNTGVRTFADSIRSGRMTLHDVHEIIEHSPRLAQAICDGLTASGYGKVGYEELLRLAERGHLNAGAISRALAL
ncbi:hypothetical protein [Rhodoligotrophos ferricapiens]|uniref:hypothetical protein n=1 Tax=Rhodoligotrophos ferricapiens TaxID=3069264 RepID=UPI00315C5F31